MTKIIIMNTFNRLQLRRYSNFNVQQKQAGVSKQKDVNMDTHTCIFLKTCSSKTTGFLSLLHVRFSRTNPHSRFRSPLACRSFESPLVPSPETECLMDKNPVTKPDLLHFLHFRKLHEAGLPLFCFFYT